MIRVKQMVHVPDRAPGNLVLGADGIREPKTAKGAATKRRLIDVAREELVERDGLLEVDSVARRAQVSVGAIYRYFDSRAGLVGAVVDDFYMRYRAEALEINPAPGASFAVRERMRTELSVAFHYSDPLASVILSNLHLDAPVAVEEAAHIDMMVALAAGVMALGQRRGELPKDRDPRFVGAMIIGGMRRVLGVALAAEPQIPQETTASRLWVLNASIMGLISSNGNGARPG
jgi:AcrR family transcriptional regulator